MFACLTTSDEPAALAIFEVSQPAQTLPERSLWISHDTDLDPFSGLQSPHANSPRKTGHASMPGTPSLHSR